MMIISKSIYQLVLLHDDKTGAVSEREGLVIVALEDGKRLTARILGDRVAIGDAVALAETRNGIPFFHKT